MSLLRHNLRRNCESNLVVAFYNWPKKCLEVQLENTRHIKLPFDATIDGLFLKFDHYFNRREAATNLTFLEEI